MHYSLGLEVWQQKGEIFLGQGRYATKILKQVGMGDCRPMAMPVITNWKKIDALEDKDVDPCLYRQLRGSLMYLVNTKPDICYALNTLSQFMVEPKRAHWAATKHILRYLQGIVDYGLLYNKGKEIWLSGLTDADWVGSSVDRKSTSGYCFNIGSRITSWCSRKQKFVALSLSEAEYIAANTASCEAIWLRKLLWSGEQSGGSKYGTERLQINAEEAEVEPEEATQRQQRLRRAKRAGVIHAEVVGVMQKPREAAQSLSRLM
eukprot:PITA_01429